jgi:hypothetical protein
MYHQFILSIPTILALFLCHLSADELSQLNPPLTKEMKINQTEAIECGSPAKVQEKFTKNFQYGCFCGKDYPQIQHPSKKNYKELNAKEREELIAQYYKIKPYDSIDESCMKHDICFIYRGREEQACNDAIYHDLKELKKIFQAKEETSTHLAKQCRVLSSDMASFFRSIFGTGEDISLLRYGMFAMTTPLTMGSKIVQKSSSLLDDEDNYPSIGERCLQ